jgi:hypothetical protein
MWGSVWSDILAYQENRARVQFFSQWTVLNAVSSSLLLLLGCYSPAIHFKLSWDIRWCWNWFIVMWVWNLWGIGRFISPIASLRVCEILDVMNVKVNLWFESYEIAVACSLLCSLCHFLFYNVLICVCMVFVSAASAVQCYGYVTHSTHISWWRLVANIKVFLWSYGWVDFVL